MTALAREDRDFSGVSPIKVRPRELVVIPTLLGFYIVAREALTGRWPYTVAQTAILNEAQKQETYIIV